MIVKSTKKIGGVEYDYSYSDKGLMIERNGARYSEAIDPFGSNREYAETTELVPDADEATEQDYQEALREMGVEL